MQLLLCRKQYMIENLEGQKVVSRKKGFTTKTCVSGVPTQQQTQQFESLPLSAKVRATHIRPVLTSSPAYAQLKRHHFTALQVAASHTVSASLMLNVSTLLRESLDAFVAGSAAGQQCSTTDSSCKSGKAQKASWDCVWVVLGPHAQSGHAQSKCVLPHAG